MSKVSYETQAYSPACFDNLRYLEDAQKELESRNLTREALMPIRELFHKHNVQKQLGLTILHRHFNMAANERLVEYGKVTTPWLLETSDIFGGKIVPRGWALHQGELYPTEFGFNPVGDMTYPDISFSSEFVDEFKDLFTKLKLDDLFGLTVLDNGNPLEMPGVERTIGRFGPLDVIKAWIIQLSGRPVSVGFARSANRSRTGTSSYNERGPVGETFFYSVMELTKIFST